MSDKQILARLRAKSGKTAGELRTNVVRMRRLEQKGLVAEVGRRQTGSRGRPAVEWAAA